jgi:hypothetical protein
MKLVILIKLYQTPVDYNTINIKWLMITITAAQQRNSKYLIVDAMIRRTQSSRRDDTLTKIIGSRCEPLEQGHSKGVQRRINSQSLLATGFITLSPQQAKGNETTLAFTQHLTLRCARPE